MMEQEGEIGNGAAHKGRLSNWGGGRWRSGVVREKRWEIRKEEFLSGGEGEGGVGWGGCKRGRSQKRTYRLEGRKREEWVGELGNVARHKRGLTNWRGGRGRSGLVSLETWHVTNEDSLTGGEEEGGAGW